jgi:myosin heavy subunit
MALYSAECNRGWVSFKDKLWLECDVVSSDATHLTLKVKDPDGIEQTKKYARRDCQFAYRNPTAVEASWDFLTLPYLDEPNILHSLRVRYWQGHVYSYTGPILIAVNPWKRVDIYNAKVLEMHKAGEGKEPHIFAVASKALRELINTRKNQCILISGESGSGKTESTKFVLQILTSSGPGEHKAGTVSIENQVMMTNPGSGTNLSHPAFAPYFFEPAVLEAFGNAKTVRNDNSSRFGKWISVHYERKGIISGAEIKTYLLEKARVVQQAENERNYHIFYQLCAASASSKMLSDLMFADASTFNYTKICLQARNMDDVKEYDEMNKALRFIGFDNDSQVCPAPSLAAITPS